MTPFFDNWQDLLRVLITAPAIYAFIVLAIRVVGKRSTSQMNNFDWVVTVALGSIAGSGIMLKDVSVSETLLAIGLLLAFQWLLTTSVMHSKLVGRLVKARPTLLVYAGEFIDAAMRQERITQGEVMSAMRDNGYTRITQVKFVILEPDASFSMVASDHAPIAEGDLQEVEGFPPEDRP